MGLLVLLAAGDSVINRSRRSVYALRSLLSCWLFFALLSDLPTAAASAAGWTDLQPLRMAQVLIGPYCAVLGCIGASGWLSAHKRDRLTQIVLTGCSLACMHGGRIGMYGLALQGGHIGLATKTAIALLALSSVVVTAAVLWLRNRRSRQLSGAGLSQRDPATQLCGSLDIVQKIIRAQARRSRTRRDGALMAVAFRAGASARASRAVRP